MKGKIIAFSKSEHKGQISGVDGNRYSFVKMDVMENSVIEKDMEVDFIADEGNAREIYTMSQDIYTLVKVICFFFPIVGYIHYFIWLLKEPIKAKKIGIISLWGTILPGIIVLIIFIPFLINILTYY